MEKKSHSGAFEDFEAVFPSGDIPCTKCKYANINGKREPKKGSCEVFPVKPPEILFDGAKCPYYKKK